MAVSAAAAAFACSSSSSNGTLAFGDAGADGQAQNAAVDAGGADAGDPKVSPRDVCASYVACVGDAQPERLSVELAAYGPDGACWKGEGEAADTCKQACAKAHENLAKQYVDSDPCAAAYPKHDGFYLALCTIAYSESYVDASFAGIVDAEFSPDARAGRVAKKLEFWFLDVAKLQSSGKIQRAAIVGSPLVADVTFAAIGQNGHEDGLLASWSLDSVSVPEAAFVRNSTGVAEFTIAPMHWLGHVRTWAVSELELAGAITTPISVQLGSPTRGDGCSLQPVHDGDPLQ